MTEWVTISVSIVALLISGATAWLTLFRPGRLQMTQPTVVFLGPDGGRPGEGEPRLKVFLRTLLYSSSQRGQIVESMHINLQRGESSQNFSIWVYGDDRLARGSGLHVGMAGVACNHHFLLPKDGADFRLLPGQYTLRVFGKRVIDPEPLELAKIVLHITDSQAHALQDPNAGIYFDWRPDQQEYHSHVDVRKQPPIPPWLFDVAKLAPAGGGSE